MTLSLASFQASFFDALLGAPEAKSPLQFTDQPGFAVYRNTVMSGCIDALRANYPTVHERVGEPRFRDLSRAFVRAAPPRDGVLAAYGDGFPAWLDEVAGADDPSLAAIAALDRCWTESHLAADAPLLEADAIRTLAPARFAAGRLVPHPTARWLTFETRPDFTIWRRSRERLPTDVVERRGESALLTRPAGVVTWREIDAGSAAFLTACARGDSIAAALDSVAGAGLDNDLAAWLPALMHARTFTRFDPRESE